jgi:sulfofructose kinase
MRQRDGRPVIFVGAATLDAIALVESYPGPDERVVALDLSYAGGGPAATAAVAAARLGLTEVAVVGVVGDDEEGERVVAGLTAEGVDTSGIRCVRGARTGTSVVVVDRNRGTRAICNRPAPPFELDAGQQRLVSKAGWVHVDHLGWPAVSSVIDLNAADRPRVSVDAGNPIDGFSPNGVDLYVPSVQALGRVFGDRDADALLDAALAEGARTVVATRGGAGSIAATADGERASAPAHPVQVVSTLGAGDVFHGALLAAVQRGYPLPDWLAYANVVAALSCRGLDGRSAIPTHEEVVPHLPSLAS